MVDYGGRGCSGQTCVRRGSGTGDSDGGRGRNAIQWGTCNGCGKEAIKEEMKDKSNASDKKKEQNNRFNHAI